VKVFRGKAFTSTKKIDGKNVLGNPASVVIYEKNLPSEKEMSKIAIEQAQPMTAFISQNNNDEFNIRYYFPNGSNVNFCGHATLVSSKIIYKLFKLTKFKFFIGFHDEIIKISIDKDNLISIKMPKYNIKYQNSLVKDINFIEILKSLNINKKDISNIYKCEELGDYVIEITNSQKLKDIQPAFQKMSKACLKLKCRAFMCTSKSDIQDFDFEIRVFAPHGGVNEDIVCGSANTHIANFWNQKIGKKTMKSLYPFNDFKNKVGGIQYILVNKDFIMLSGYVI
jgi:PhzF family phenazine biosynthesis protein